VASLEGADDALAFNSGMGAISTAVLALAKGGLKVLTTMELYSLTKAKGKPRLWKGRGKT
jgi:cystathionine beta-lyase/cystathionine gamma-synthase